MAQTMAHAGGVGRQEAQAQVPELQESVASVNNDVHHLELLQNKMGALHKSSRLIYVPFRDRLVEGAKADKAERDH